MQSILKVDKLSKTYSSGIKELTVLNDINFELNAGDKFSIVGSSGSGKTTLLGLCAGLDKATTGTVHLNGVELGAMNEDERAAIRNQYVGFVFQNFQLLPTLTAIENVMVPMELRGERKVYDRAMHLLDRVGLADRFDHYPTQLSGGEQQRISIARAFSNAPKILFADEPTGNLDEETSQKIENLLFDLNKENGTTLVMVTHDMELALKTDRILRLKGGKIVDDQLVKGAAHV